MERLACVTGASSGIGAEFARQLHAQGTRLLLVARREDRLRELARELETIRPHSVEIFSCDLSQPGTADGGTPGWLQLEELLRSREVDVLVNNAGVGSFGLFDELEVDREEAMVALNVVAPLRLTHAVLPQMKARRAGLIFWTSSVAGFQPLPLMATYAATKQFELSHALALAAELRSSNVKVCVSCPGPTATEFAGVARVPGTATGGYRDSAAVVVERALKDAAKGRVISIPTWRARMMVLGTKLVPRILSSRILLRSLEKPLRLSRKP